MPKPDLSAPFVPGTPILSVPKSRSFRYQLGTVDPPIRPDPGAGEFFQKSPDHNMRTLRDVILAAMPLAAGTVGEDAAKHLQHYFERSGADYVIDLEKMVREVASAGVLFQSARDEAKEFAATLPPGRHAITSATARSGKNDVGASRNWYYAVGGYGVWGKGKVVVEATDSRTWGYTLFFEYRFLDYYNWDKGKEVNLMGVKISDSLLAEFHRQGLAREFKMVGTIKRVLTGKRAADAPAAAPPAANSKTVTIDSPQDTLSGFARDEYGSWELWPLIWDSNRSAVGPNPNRLTQGTILQIAALSSYTAEQVQDAKRRAPSWKDYPT
jgi:nucleoid-associated protein YgaU